MENFNIEKLHNEVDRIKYQVEINNRFQKLEETDTSLGLDGDPNCLKEAIEKTGKLAAYKVLCKKKKPKNKPSFDDEYELWFGRCKKVKLDSRHNRCEKLIEEYHNARNQIATIYRNEK